MDLTQLDVDRLSRLIADLEQSASAIEILRQLGLLLQQQLQLESVWIAYPASVDAEQMYAYWIFNHRVDSPGQDPSDQPAPDSEATNLGTTNPEATPSDPMLSAEEEIQEPVPISETQIQILEPDLLKQLHTSEDQMLTLSAQRSPWISTHPLVDPGMFPYLIGSPPNQPQCLVAYSPKGDLPWLLGLVGLDPDRFTQAKPLIQSLRQLALLALEKQALQQRAFHSEQYYRFTTNRLMDRFRVATEATRQVVYEWEMATDQVEWSPSLRAVFGHLPSEHTDTRSWWLSCVHPDDRAYVLQQLQESMDLLQIFLCEYRWRRADGFFAWVRDYGRIFCGPQNKIVRMVGSLEDITARRGTTAALQQMKQKFQITFNLSRIGLITTDANFKVLEANLLVQGILGYPLQALSQLESLRQIMDPDDIEVDAADFEMLLKGEISRYTTHKRLLNVGGQALPCQIEILSVGDRSTELQLLWQIRPELTQGTPDLFDSPLRS